MPTRFQNLANCQKFVPFKEKYKLFNFTKSNCFLFSPKKNQNIGPLNVILAFSQYFTVHLISCRQNEAEKHCWQRVSIFCGLPSHCNGFRYTCTYSFYSLSVESDFYGDISRVAGFFTKLSNVQRG